ncbi:hypothetical protein EYF80_026128 [Liparis tanakae]|uniref:Uncharacterized protein n=1 Tax=Liparis tanakae TaxID=230148 RepID=A0A4Z2HFL5_9TELE|nr:hypothetical protein EYF80_026128 [Liparis tanakae]
MFVLKHFFGELGRIDASPFPRPTMQAAARSIGTWFGNKKGDQMRAEGIPNESRLSTSKGILLVVLNPQRLSRESEAIGEKSLPKWDEEIDSGNEQDRRVSLEVASNKNKNKNKNKNTHLPF